MATRILPNLSIEVTFGSEPVSLSDYLTDNTYWVSESQTANLLMRAPTSNAGPVYLCLDGETESTRSWANGDSKTYGPVTQKTMGEFFLVGTSGDVIWISFEEVASEG
jgi:hypothetical protein